MISRQKVRYHCTLWRHL